MLSLKSMSEAPVKDCPHTRKAVGIVRMSPTLIAELASAVTDKDEWAIVCQGERLGGGYEVVIKSWSIPPQDRSSGHVSIKEFDLNLEDVLVIHSHHHLGAFFSTIDTSTLNPRFPVSIVVAHGAKTYLGFDYKGTGKVTLPCGSTGEIEFKIQATEGPLINSASKVIHLDNNLGDCKKFSNDADDYHVHHVAVCGLAEKEVLRAAAFGTSATLLEAVAKLDRPVLVNSTKVYSSGSKMTQNQIMEDPDSHWCLEHKKWDWCEYRATLTTIPSDGGDTADRGWLGKYEELAGRSSTTSSTDETWCDDCHNYLPFLDWSCEVCGAPWCRVCEEGHAGPCSDSAEDICRCGAVIGGNFIYCSTTCYEYYEPPVEIKVEGKELRGTDLGDGCIKIL